MYDEAQPDTAQTNALRFEKGILRPCLSLLRAATEAQACREEKYLSMPADQLKEERRCVNEGTTDCPDLKYYPVTKEECEKNLNDCNEKIPVLSALEIATRLGAFENTVKTVSRTVTALFDPQSIARRAAAEAAQVEPYQEFEPDDLLALPYIPTCLEKDQVFHELICPITQRPICHPVLDPTNHITVYERAAILESLRERPHSAVTRLPLEPDQLIPLPALQTLINDRLAIYQAHFKNKILKVGRFPPNIGLLNAAKEEHGHWNFNV
jgi:hypothetical protein